MANIQKMLKQAQKMQKNMEDVQSKLSEDTIEYTGNGVRIVAKCDLSISSLTIDPELLESTEDKDILEDCITLAINNALQQARDKMEAEMGKVTSGFNIPGMF